MSSKEYIIPSKEYIDNNLNIVKGDGWDNETIKKNSNDLRAAEGRISANEGNIDLAKGRLDTLEGATGTSGSVLHTIENVPHIQFTSSQFISAFQKLFNKIIPGTDDQILSFLNEDPDAVHTIFEIRSPDTEDTESTLSFHNVSDGVDDWVHDLSMHNHSTFMKVVSVISHFTGSNAGSWEWWTRYTNGTNYNMIERRVMVLNGDSGYLLIGERSGDPQARLDVHQSGNTSEPAVQITIDSSHESSPEALVVKNFSNYAITDVLVRLKIVNETDTATVLKLENAGTGDYIDADSKFRVDKEGNVLPNNLVISWSETPNNVNFPSEKLVKDVLDDHSSRINTLEESSATFDSIIKISDGPFTEEQLLVFMETLPEGIYTISTLRNGKEIFFKGTITIENLETGLEEVVLRYSRFISNGTSYEWNDGLQEWAMSAGGGGGGGGGGTLNPIRLYPYPLGISTSISSAVNSDLELSIQYQNALVTTGTLRVLRNGSMIALRSINTGVYTFPVGSYIQTGVNNFDFEVTDAFSNTAKVSYLVTGISVSITSTFNDSIIQSPSGSIVFSILAGGSRFSVVTLDGVVTETPAPTITNIFDYVDLSHGTHTLSLQAKSVLPGDIVIYSNKLDYLMIVAEPENYTPIIASKFSQTEAPEGSVLRVDYIAYQLGAELVTVQFYVDDILVGTSQVDRSRKVWNIPSLAIGDHELKIVCGATEKVFSVEITELDVEFTNVEDSFLKLFLSAAAKSNTALDKEEWLPLYGDTVPVYLQNFNYATNGWIDGGLEFNGLASAVIVYKPFSSEIPITGATLEFELETRNSYGTTIPFIKCMNGERGFEIYSNRAILKSSNATAVAFFKENERIKISFVIDKVGRTMTTYINGVMTGLNRLANDSFFVQSSPQNIIINSDYVSGVLYSFRAYTRTLSMQEILQNYLYDLPSIDEKLIEYNFSDIFDDAGEVNFNKLSERLPVLKIRGYQTDPNGNYLPETDNFRPYVDAEFVNPFDHTKDFSFTNVRIRTQGTSTLIYPVKNYRMYLPEGSNYQLDVNETRPTLILNPKTDYMESSLATNVGLCRLINDILYDKKLPIQLKEPTEEDPYPHLSRSSTYGYPIAMFLDDGNTLQFWGLYNLNTDKSDPQTFGHYPESGFDSQKFENVRNVGNSAGAFIRKPELTDEEWFDEVAADFESNYPKQDPEDATLENYQPLMDVIEFVSDYPGLDDPDIATYKAEFEQRIDIEYAIKYLLTCLVVGAVDSFGKDLMLNTWGNEGGLYPKWYLTFYDLDTCVGIDNTGHMLESDGVTPKYDYDIELVDEGAFAQAQSRLWDVINELFAEEVADYYATLRTGAFSYDTLWHYLYDEQIAKIAKGMYNANAIRKYVEAPGAEQYLHMLHGDRITQMSRWLSNRLLFLDSKYAYNTDAKKLSFRITTDDASQVSFTLTTDTHQWVEILVGNDDLPESHGIARSKAGVPVVVAPSYASGKTLFYAEGYFYNAERIVDFGDFGRNENYTLELLNIADAPNLLVCNLEQATPSTSLTSFTIGNNYELTELNLRNNVALTGVLDLSACTKLSKLDLRGTGITSVEFPEGGVLEECYLPNTITSLTLINQPYLNPETFSVEAGAEFGYLRVENCPGVDIVSLLSMSGPTVALRLLDISISSYESDTIDLFINETSSAVGIDINGNITTGPPILYGSIKVLDPTDSIDLSIYEAALPNIVFSKIVVDNDFIVSDVLNSRGNCTLESYVGTSEIVEIPSMEYNAYLSESVPYTVGQYGWGIIDEIGSNVFNSGIEAVHLTEVISVVNSFAFSALFTGVVTTPALILPSGWSIGTTEIRLNSDVPIIQNDYLLSVSSGNVNLFRYYGEDSELAIPTSLTINEVARVPNYLSKDLLLNVDEQITELHIPSNITIIGSGFTSYLNSEAIIWVMASSKPVGWSSDWNTSLIETYFGAPATKRTFNLYNDSSLEVSLEEYGLLDKDRVANSYGYGLYADETFVTEISYPYYGTGVSNSLYMGLILAPISYTYDVVNGNQYYVSGYDKTRMEGNGRIRLVIAANYNDGVNGSYPVTFVAEDAIGHSIGTEASVLKEVIFETNLNFNHDGYPIGMLGGASELTLFVPPANATIIPNFFRIGCENLPMMSLNSVTNIGDYAFADNLAFTEVVIPDTVTSIGIGAFSCGVVANAQLVNVVIYASGAIIGDSAFVTGNYFRDVYTVSDTGIYGRQEDDTWIQVSELPIDEQYFTINESGLITSYDIAGGTELVPPATIDGVTVVGYAAHALDGVAISNLYLGSNITYIGAYAFADTALTSVIIPNSVTYIGPNAFLGLSEDDISLDTGVDSYVVYEDDGATLAGHIASFADSSFTIPDTVTKVKSYAFESSLIESLDIHAGVTVIEDRAFINSEYLSTISLYAEKQNISIGTSLIIEGENSFNTAVANEPSFNGRGVYGKQLDNSWLWIEEVWLYTWSLADFTYNVTEVYDNTSGANMYIGDYVVLNYKEDLGVTSLNVPAKVAGYPVFWKTGLIPASTASSIQNFAMHPSILATTTQAGGILGNGKRFARIDETGLAAQFLYFDNLEHVHTLPQNASNCASLFQGKSKLKSAVIPEMANNISSMFDGCSNLTSAPVIPANVTLMSSTFSGCSSLTSAPAIPANVTNMASTFSNCSNLTSAPAIPANVTSMSQTFASCSKLTSPPAIPSNVTNMSETFSSCYNLTSAPNIPNSVTNMRSTFAGCSSLTEAPAIPANVTDMSYTFSSCSNLTSAPAIPANVTDMSRTFQYCYNLTSPPDMSNAINVTTMSNTFNGCSNLTSAPAIPANVIDMSSTFFGCSKLTEALNIPTNVTNMFYTFRNCSNLTSPPDMSNAINVTTMYGTFSYCSKLTSAPTIPANVTTMHETFYNCSNLTSPPDMSNVVNLTSLYSTFSRCSSLTSAPVIPANVTTMYSTFSNCSNLTSAPVIPANVTNMASTFSNCSNLTSAPNIPNSVTNMSSTFRNCFNLTSAPAIPSNVTSMVYTFSGCSSLTSAPAIPANVTNMYSTFSSCLNIEGDIFVYTDKVLIAGGMNGAFNGTNAELPKSVYMPYTGYNATHNTKAAADYSSIDGNNGVTINPIPAGSTLDDYAVYKTANVIEPMAVTGLAEDTVYTDALIIDKVNASKDWTFGVIPSTINGQQVFVTSNLFNVAGVNTVVEKVTFDSGVRAINAYPAGDTQTSNMNFFGYGMFSKGAGDNPITPNLKEVHGYPDTKSMPNAFANVRSLISAPAIPSNVTNMSSTFSGCSNLTSPPDLSNAVNLTTMANTFQSCSNLTTPPVIPNSVTNMFSTFYFCNCLTTPPVIPNSVTNISATFNVCSNLTSPPVIPNSVTDMSNTFSSCSNLTSAPVIPSNVTNMSRTFQYCSNLTTPPDLSNAVNLSNMTGTFQSCSNLTSPPDLSNAVNLSNMSSTFSGCSNLTSAPAIPANVVNMANTFNGCLNLTSAPVISNSVTDMASTFARCYNLTSAPIIPPNVTNMSSTFFSCSNLTEAPIIPANVISMSSTFSDCFNLTSPPDMSNAINVTNMSGTFNACSNLTSAPVISNSVTNMANTFNGCYSLTSAPDIPNSVTNMTNTFRDCSNLTSAPVIPNSVTNMYSTFYGCNSLTSPPSIPNSVIDMSYTFTSCRGLTSPPDFSNAINVVNMPSTFSSCPNLTSPPNLSNAINVVNMSSTFYGCYNLTSPPSIPNSVTTMSSTFSGCHKLTSAPVIPNSVTNMYSTFWSCYNLTSAPVIPNSVTHMYGTFEGCINLTGDVIIQSNQVNNMSSCFMSTNAQLPKSVYMPYTGYNATHNTYLAATNASIDGNNGVTVMDINTYLG